MRLPNARLALVAREKIADYLLNAAHPDNGGKAEFFASLGFRREEWELLARAFRGLATATEVMARLESAHGMAAGSDVLFLFPGEARPQSIAAASPAPAPPRVKL